MMLTDEDVQPLLNDKAKRLIALAKSDKSDASELIDSLRARSKAVATALGSYEMFEAMLSPSEARAVLRYLQANGPAKLEEAATQVGEREWVVIEQEK